MSFAIPTNFEAPGAPTGAQWVFQIWSKTFEANTPALLQTAINAWLLTLQADAKDHAILDVQYQSGAKEKALFVYGAYVNVNDVI